MRTHTAGLKNQLKTLGRELNSKLTYTIGGTTTILQNEELNSVVLFYRGNILKSVMKELEVDSNIDIPIGTIVNYQLGVKVNNSFEYLDYGNYIVYKSEKQEDYNSFKITCYDKMLYSMVENETLDITYPITIRSYITAICEKLGLVFSNSSDTFANYDKTIEKELYAGLQYTYRDILDELAQVTASTICINNDDELEIRYITETNDVIDEEFIKDINVNFGEQTKAINTIVLSRSAGSDKISLSYPEDLEDEYKNSIEIADNQIMNWDNRGGFLQDILDKLYGMQYYINDFSSIGICYYELCDRYTVKIGSTNYSCVMLNDEINVTQGLEENIYTDPMEETVTDYKKADKIGQKINDISLIVDQQNRTIIATAQEVTDVKNDLSTNYMTSNEVNSSINNVKDDVETVRGRATTLEVGLDGIRAEVTNNTSSIHNMQYNFGTDNLSIASSTSKVNMQLNNTGMVVKNYDTLTAVYNDKGSGVDKLIVTGTAQLGYLKVVKGLKNNKKVTQIFHLENLIEDLEDLVGG